MQYIVKADGQMDRKGLNRLRDVISDQKQDLDGLRMLPGPTEMKNGRRIRTFRSIHVRLKFEQDAEKLKETLESRLSRKCEVVKVAS